MNGNPADSGRGRTEFGATKRSSCDGIVEQQPMLFRMPSTRVIALEVAHM